MYWVCALYYCYYLFINHLFLLMYFILITCFECTIDVMGAAVVKVFFKEIIVIIGCFGSGNHNKVVVLANLTWKMYSTILNTFEKTCEKSSSRVELEPSTTRYLGIYNNKSLFRLILVCIVYKNKCHVINFHS